MFTPERPLNVLANAQPDRHLANKIGRRDRMRHCEKPPHEEYLAQSLIIH
jgi:hypothetical protein